MKKMSSITSGKASQVASVICLATCQQSKTWSKNLDNYFLQFSLTRCLADLGRIIMEYEFFFYCRYSQLGRLF